MAPLSSPTSPTSPKSPTIQGFDNVNLKSLAQSTKKTFERLSPYTLIQNPSRPEDSAALVDPLVERFRQRVQGLIVAIDSSIGAVETLYHISTEAGTLCELTPLSIPADKSKTADETGKEVANGTEATSSADKKAKEKNPMSRVSSVHSLLQLRRSRSDREDKLQQHRARVDELASKACEQASKAASAFKQVDQELFKIAAATKDMPAESTVEIPVDPAAPKLITKSLRDLGNDLVGNLGLLSTFSGHLNDLNDWSEWVKNGVASSDFEGGSALLPSDVDTPNRRKHLDSQWAKVLSDTVLYHNMLSDMLARYINLLPQSAESWQVVIEQRENDKKTGKLKGEKKGTAGKAVDVIIEAVKQLSCHACCCF